MYPSLGTPAINEYMQYLAARSIFAWAVIINNKAANPGTSSTFSAIQLFTVQYSALILHYERVVQHVFIAVSLNPI